MGNDELDRLVDEALRAYGGNPRPGIERRVLNRVAAAPVAARWPLRRWIFASLALSCCIAVLVRPVRPRVEQRPPREVMRAQVLPAIPQTPARRAGTFRRRKKVGSPEAITDQERALLALVQRAPFEAEQILTFADPAPIDPVAIEEITIPPLLESGQ